MSVGLSPTKNDIDSTGGDIARSFFYQFRRAEQFKYYLDSKTDPELTSLGYTAGEIASLRTAAIKMDDIRQIWQGIKQSALSEDYRTFPRRLSGLGDV